MPLAGLIELTQGEALLNARVGAMLGDDIRISSEIVTRAGMTGRHLRIEEGAPRRLVHWLDIRELIKAADLPAAVIDRSVACMTRLAEAEAAIHGVAVDRVHFHELGAVDTLVDVVGSMLLVDALSVGRIEARPVNLGGGTVTIAHGRVPVPAAATLALARGVPVYGEPGAGELATPTGMALLAELADAFGPMPAMIPSRVAYGAGTKDRSEPSLLRLTLGEGVETVEGAAA